MMKKPLPSMAMSRPLPVAEIEPGLKSRVVPAIFTPSPIWYGFVPPSLVLGCVPLLSVRLNWVSKYMLLDLKAVVFALAMLLPITSRRRALAFIPDRPVYIALVDAMEFLPYR